MKLNVQSPERDLQPIEVTEFPCVIGRDPTCDLHLNDRRVSRQHACLKRQAQRFLVADLNSANGIELNGQRVTGEASLRKGDEIRIGESRITVTELPERQKPGDDPAPRPARTPRRARRFLMTTVAPILTTLAALGGLAYFAVTWQLGSDAREENPIRAAAIVELERLERQIAAAPAVLPEHFRAAEQLRRKYKLELDDRLNPFVEFLRELREQEARAIENRLFEFTVETRALLEQGNYAAALRLAEEFETAAEDKPHVVRERVSKFTAKTRSQVDAAFKSFLRDLGYLESPAFIDDWQDLFEAGEAAFDHEQFAPALRQERATFAKILAKHEAAETKRREALASRVAALRKKRAAVARAKTTTATAKLPGLFDLLSRPLGAGAFKERTYTIGEVKGRPIGIQQKSLLELDTETGSVKIALKEVPHSVQLRMAYDGLRGSALLEAATLGYRWGEPQVAGKLLYRYSQSAAIPKEKRQQEVEQLLVSVRGLRRVPDGGYTYSTKYGWEDTAQKDERRITENARRWIGKLTVLANEKSLRKSFAKVLGYLDDAKLSRAARRELRKETLAKLDKIRVKAVKDLTKQVDKIGFGALRKVRIELDKRRAAALAVIYDVNVYLPEDHPDWRKGDEVNGQAEVDRVVNGVRELWDNAGKYSVTMGKNAKHMSKLRLVDEEFHPKLKHRPAKKDAALTDLWNNLNNSVDLRTFALDRQDSLHHEYNRKVEAYNRTFQHEDLADGEKEHMIFVNDYREMMGHRRMFLDIRLCRATRKHSAEQDKAGRIWHRGPNGTPSSRARAEGFPSGVGENVAIGYANPRDIWTRGWYRASDHHRNALQKRWNCIGYGYSGRVGTQNFAAIGAPFR